MQWGAHVTLATGLITIALGEASRLAPSPALSIACGLLFVSGILSAQLGAILPDLIDFAFARVGLKHRNRATHGVSSLLIPFFLVVFMWGLFIICWPLISVVIWGIALGLPTGWGSHLLLDALNPSGIPLSSKTFTWDWAPYDSPAGNRVLKKVGGICLLAGTLTLVDPVYPLFLPLFAALWAGQWRSDRVRESDLCVKALTTKNVEVVATLTAIGTIYSRRGDTGRAIAYRNAARSIRNQRWSLKDCHSRHPLQGIQFVGPKIVGIIQDVPVHGHSRYLDFLRGTLEMGRTAL